MGRTLRSLLVPGSANDPLTLGSIAALFAIVSLAACLVPGAARHRDRSDPRAALR